MSAEAAPLETSDAVTIPLGNPYKFGFICCSIITVWEFQLKYFCHFKENGRGVKKDRLV